MANGRDRWPYEYDRPRGIFTPRDRRFLAGELDDELTDNQKRQKRFRLRQRLFHAMQDLAYLKLVDTRDLARVADDLDRASTPEVDPSQEEIDPSVTRHLERTIDATEETLGFFTEILAPELTIRMIEDELAARAAVDYYEANGEYAVVEPTVEVELQDTLSIETLKDRYQLNTYPGATEVLRRAGEGLGTRRSSSSNLDVDVDVPDHLVDTAVDVMFELDDDGSGADRAAVAQMVMDRRDVTEAKAFDAIDAALLAGHCYEPKPNRLKAI